MAPPPADFSAARKVLVMELAGLGDGVHLLPALAVLRRALPQARIEVMVSAHVADLLRLAPGVDRVWAYPRVPRRPGLFANLRWLRALRRERYDLLINTTGSDRSALLAGASGAARRLIRRPPGGGRFWFPWLFTGVLEHPFWQEPMYRQKLAVFAQAGFAAPAPPFDIQLDPQARRALGIAAQDDGRYLHLSPCAGLAQKELPIAQLVEICSGLRRAHPDLPLALSCADLPRERARLDALLQALPQPPWKAFAGSLDIPRLAAVIQGAALHVGGDSGSLHLAFMAGTAAVAWFREHVNMREWMPPGPRYRVLVAPDGERRDALHGVETDQVLRAAAALLHTAA